MSTLSEVNKRRADRKEALRVQEDTQRALDLEAIDALEIQFGDSNVTVVDVAFTPGQATCFAVRTPSDPEMKRYKSRIKGVANSKEIDAVGAAEEVGESCLIYPADPELRAAMKLARPGALAACGTEALKLGNGRAASEGKG